jgi:hypothetical protein
MGEAAAIGFKLGRCGGLDRDRRRATVAAPV